MKVNTISMHAFANKVNVRKAKNNAGFIFFSFDNIKIHISKYNADKLYQKLEGLV